MRDDDTTQRAATRWPYMLGSDARASRGNYGYNSSPAFTPTGVSLAAHVVATAPGAPHLNDGRPAGNCNKSQPDDENNICLRELAEDVALEARPSHLGGLETADIPTAAEDMAPEATEDMAPTVGTIRADTKQQAAGTAGPTDTIGTNPGASRQAADYQTEAPTTLNGGTGDIDQQGSSRGAQFEDIMHGLQKELEEKVTATAKKLEIFLGKLDAVLVVTQPWLCRQQQYQDQQQQQQHGQQTEQQHQHWDASASNAPMPASELVSVVTSGSSYAVYWKQQGDEYVVRGDFVLPERAAALKEARGDDKTFASETRKVRLPAAGNNMVASAAASGKEVVLDKPAESSTFKRASLAKEFNVASIHCVPCAGGVLVCVCLRCVCATVWVCSGGARVEGRDLRAL